MSPVIAGDVDQGRQGRAKLTDRPRNSMRKLEELDKVEQPLSVSKPLYPSPTPAPPSVFILKPHKSINAAPYISYPFPN